MSPWPPTRPPCTRSTCPMWGRLWRGRTTSTGCSPIWRDRGCPTSTCLPPSGRRTRSSTTTPTPTGTCGGRPWPTIPSSPGWARPTRSPSLTALIILGSPTWGTSMRWSIPPGPGRRRTRPTTGNLPSPTPGPSAAPRTSSFRRRTRTGAGTCSCSGTPSATCCTPIWRTPTARPPSPGPCPIPCPCWTRPGRTRCSLRSWSATWTGGPPRPPFSRPRSGS